MDNAGRTRMTVRLVFLAVALSISLSSYAQPARPATPPDIAGEWVLQSNEDPGQIGGQGQPTLGYYLGIPFNDAGRMRADTSAESLWGTPEYQCRPHSAPHQWRGLGGVRILKEEDPLTRDIIGVPHPVHAVARLADLYGWTSASAGVGAPHVDAAFPPVNGSATR